MRYTLQLSSMRQPFQDYVDEIFRHHLDKEDAGITPRQRQRGGPRRASVPRCYNFVMDNRMNLHPRQRLAGLFVDHGEGHGFFAAQRA